MVKQLKNRYGNLQNIILHSDRGSQYTSEAFRGTLRKYGIIQSLSGTGHCYDNARMESFFATLKKEKLYRMPTYKMTREEVKTEIFRYVYVYYNRIRIYSRNPGYLPPAIYRMEYEKGQLQHRSRLQPPIRIILISEILSRLKRAPPAALTNPEN